MPRIPKDIIKRDIKRAHYRRGLSAEVRAAAYLEEQGYVRLGHRVVGESGEIDLVMHHGTTLCFIEVKCRSTLEEALESITPAKQRKIARAAELYLQENPCYERWDVRFDVVAVCPQNLTHMPNAWMLEEVMDA